MKRRHYDEKQSRNCRSSSQSVVCANVYWERQIVLPDTGVRGAFHLEGERVCFAGIGLDLHVDTVQISSRGPHRISSRRSDCLQVDLASAGLSLALWRLMRIEESRLSSRRNGDIHFVTSGSKFARHMTQSMAGRRTGCLSPSQEKTGASLRTGLSGCRLPDWILAADPWNGRRNLAYPRVAYQRHRDWKRPILRVRKTNPRSRFL